MGLLFSRNRNTQTLRINTYRLTGSNEGKSVRASLRTGTPSRPLSRRPFPRPRSQRVTENLAHLATLRDVVSVAGADEAHHRDINREFANELAGLPQGVNCCSLLPHEELERGRTGRREDQNGRRPPAPLNCRRRSFDPICTGEKSPEMIAGSSVPPSNGLKNRRISSYPDLEGHSLAAIPICFWSNWSTATGWFGFFLEGWNLDFAKRSSSRGNRRRKSSSSIMLKSPQPAHRALLRHPLPL
jgi:hypothetical protein